MSINPDLHSLAHILTWADLSRRLGLFSENRAYHRGVTPYFATRDPKIVLDTIEAGNWSPGQFKSDSLITSQYVSDLEDPLSPIRISG